MKLHLIYVGIIFVLVAVFAVGLYEYGVYKEHEAKRDTEIEVKDQQNKVLAQQNQQLQATVAQIQADTARQIAALEQQRQVIHTSPAAAAQVVRQVLPTAVPTALPDAPSQINKADSITLADYKLQCDEWHTSAIGCDEQLKAKDEQISNLETEKKNLQDSLTVAQKSHKTGFWRKVGCLVAGGAGAGLGTAIPKTDVGKAKGAAVGAALGAGLCWLTH